MSMRPITDYLCQTYGQNRAGHYASAMGFLISARLMLTAYHVIEGAKSLLVINQATDRSSDMLFDPSQTWFDVDSDVALVTLAEPIGPEDDYRSAAHDCPSREFRLLTYKRANMEMGFEPMSVPVFPTRCLNNPNFTRFVCADDIIKGQSGSVVVDGNNRIAGVLSQHIPHDKADPLLEPFLHTGRYCDVFRATTHNNVNHVLSRRFA